jgi:hypothetical protein
LTPAHFGTCYGRNSYIFCLYYLLQPLSISVSIMDFVTDCAKPLDYAATGSVGIFSFLFFFMLPMRLYQ